MGVGNLQRLPEKPLGGGGADQRQPAQVGIDVGVIVKQGQQIIVPWVAAVKQVEPRVRQRRDQPVQIHRRCGGQIAQPGVELDHRTGLAGQATDIPDHVLVKSAVLRLSSFSVAVSRLRAAPVKVLDTIAEVVGNGELENTVLGDQVGDGAEIAVEILLVDTLQIHRRIVAVVVAAIGRIADSEHVAPEHRYKQVAAALHHAGMAVVVQQDLLVPAVLAEDSQMVIWVQVGRTYGLVQLTYGIRNRRNAVQLGQCRAQPAKVAVAAVLPQKRRHQPWV